MDKIRLEMTKEQGQAVAAALDLAVRIGLGQFEEIANLMMSGVVRATERVPTDETDEFIAVRARLEAMMLKGKAVLGHPSNGSYGIGSERLHVNTLRAYETMKVLDKALFSLRPDAATAFKGPNSDGLVVRYTSDPEPVAVALAA